jgi:hypothetical protein
MAASSLYLLFWTVGCITGFLAALSSSTFAAPSRRRRPSPLALAWLFLFVGLQVALASRDAPVDDALAVSPAELFRSGRRLPLGC